MRAPNSAKSVFACVVLLAAVGCGDAERAPPPASFLLVAGDSTFWITSASGETHVRRSPLLLAYIDRTFHEVYVTDDDRSYFDAVIVGQRVYRRDLLRGDSLAVFEDSTLEAIAADYAAAHPNERPLDEYEDAAPDPGTVAVTDTEIIDVLGPFAVLQYHADIALASGEQRHRTCRSVVDLRSGQRMTLADFVPDSLRPQVVEAGRAAFAAAQDSVRASDDERAQIATQHLDLLSFDTTSFSLVVTATGNPAIAFFAPGEGPDGGDLGLAVDAVEIPPGAWWSEIVPTLPTSRSEQGETWSAPGYDVVVTYDSFAATALVLVRDEADEDWPVGSFPTPIWRVHRLDGSRTSKAIRRALARAFDETTGLSEGFRKSASRQAPAGGRPFIPSSSFR